MKIRCIKLLNVFREPTDDQYWVKLGAIYQVLTIWVDERGVAFRIISERDESPGLHPLEMFEIVSPIIPPNWVIASPSPGCLSLAPEPWTQKGFWERYFDFEPEALECFEREKAKILAADP